MKLPPIHTDISIRLNDKHGIVLKDFIIYLVIEHSYISFSVEHTLASVDADNYHTVTLHDMPWAYNGADILGKLSALMDEGMEED